MKSISLLAMAVLCATLLGCNQPKEASTEETSPALEEAAFVNEEGVLQLNNGAKWPANAETTAGVAQLKSLVDVFEEGDSSSALAAYNELGLAMHTQMKNIFANCTMTGDAHNELHDFLYPMMADIKKLQGEELDIAKASLASLKTQLAKYSTYFK